MGRESKISKFFLYGADKRDKIDKLDKSRGESIDQGGRPFALVRARAARAFDGNAHSPRVNLGGACFIDAFDVALRGEFSLGGQYEIFFSR